MTETPHREWAKTAPAPLQNDSPQASPVARNVSELLTLVELGRQMPIRGLATSLTDLGMVSEEALAPYVHSHTPLDHAGEQALVDAGLISAEDLEHARAHVFNLPEVEAMAFAVEPTAWLHIALEAAVNHHVLPLASFGGVLYVATSTPLNRSLETELGVIANCTVSLVWASHADITHRLAREMRQMSGLPEQGDASSLVEHALEHPLDVHSLLSEAMSELRSVSDPEQVNITDESSSVIKLVNRMITDAYDQKASDIHIETNPGDEVSRIRFRKDGDLEDYLMLPFVLRAALVSRIKIMSRLDISERRRPQDGKINFHDFAPIKLELRVAVLPTHDNLEDVVMRLLATSKPIPLQQLGFSSRDETLIKRMSERQFGLILACGPTGSGKTTTLHSLLAHINTDARKIWTAEDPIEITQKGLRQLQVNTKIGVTFASAMRAFLRADPDVIMIGEVRDEETASTCVEASLTGHLVFSTLHTNSAAESVIRLLDLGMDAMNFGDSLVGIVAQRLVRGLCKQCAQPRPLSGNELESLVEEYVEGTSLTVEEGSRRLLQAAGQTDVEHATPIVAYHAVGCSHCNGRGYKGRMGIYEILENTPTMKPLIQARRPTLEIFMEASRGGMRTLRQDALEKVLRGLIDLKQARTV